MAEESGVESPPTDEMNSLSVEASSSSAPQMMSPEERFRIVRSVGEECIQEDELLNLLTKKPQPICYDGFEPSGRMHIAQGVMKTISVNKLTSAGCKVKIWVADWFAQLNNKMGGDLKKIQTVGRYLIEIWKAIGMDVKGVEFLWSSEEINARASEYWPLVMDIARRNKLPRILRCVQIMGRSEQDELSAASILYPCMQCADIFFLKADICQLGMDQRKVNVLAREYCDDIKRKNKPIILSHHMLPGLQQGQEKMSKSDPSSAIYMEDEEAEVNVKIKKAYCPPKIVEGNPCLEYIKFIIFPWFNEFKVERSEANGGDKTYTSYEELIADYEGENLHPADLKPALSKALNKILQPVRDHFIKDPTAKDLLKRVKAYWLIYTTKIPSTYHTKTKSEKKNHDNNNLITKSAPGFNRSFTIQATANNVDSRPKINYASLNRAISVNHKLYNSKDSVISVSSSIKGKVKKLCNLFESNKSSKARNVETESFVKLSKPVKSLSLCYNHESSMIKLPGTEDRIVVYLTSLRGIRRTFEDCYAVRMIFRGFRVWLDERDISMDSAYKKELHCVFGGKNVTLPQVFIRGKHVGGADVIKGMFETGELARVLDGFPRREPGFVCRACGDVRFVPCGNCSGSRKLFDEDDGVLKRCLVCNENGLIRCPDCCS